MPIDIIGGGEVVQHLERELPALCKEAITRALWRSGQIVRRDAVRYAPRSPIMKILSATLKRKKRTKQRTKPGGSEKSITLSDPFEEDAETQAISVFVPSNSYAAAYARRIHDQKRIKWQHRGPGTIAKGGQADEKFVFRALEDNTGRIARIFESEARKMGK